MKRTDKIEVGAFARTLRRSGIYVYAYDKEEDRMVFFSDQENCCREVLHWQDFPGDPQLDPSGGQGCLCAAAEGQSGQNGGDPYGGRRFHQAEAGRTSTGG